ncbi:hypothetical protein IAR55_002197 [Kwoniella newhampshirensis]|uniref:ER membrane protein complex subunit 7 beta-sandwich domain-containing protein n=1 Tax=Kwoniella newhampshirensis TaxID=1651941 RepID=A0AAW0YQH3_9TREE
MRVSASLLATLSLLPVITAVTVSGQIAFSQLLPRAGLAPSSQVSLDYGSAKVWIKKDGSFEINNVDEGEHVLETLVPGYVFHPLLITVLPEPSSLSDQTTPSPPPTDDDSDKQEPVSSTTPPYKIHIQLFNPSREPLPPSTSSLPHPIEISPLGKEDYFMPKGGMNVLGMLKSPMVLMMLFSAVMMWGMPKMMASMADLDPETAKEMAETRKKMAGVQNMDWAGSLSNMLAGTTEEPTPKVPAPAAGTPNRSGATAGQSQGGKKRRGR